MNERIRQLAEQAGATVITTHGMEHVVDGCYVIGPARLEKFAELIVRECVDRIKRVGILEDIEIEGDMISDAVKEHFGVDK